MPKKNLPCAQVSSILRGTRRAMGQIVYLLLALGLQIKTLDVALALVFFVVAPISPSS